MPAHKPPILFSEKRSNDNNIRLWCKDLENGFDNLELWNGWIENTLESVKIMEMTKGTVPTQTQMKTYIQL